MAAICPTYRPSWLFVEARAGCSNDLTDREQAITRKIIVEAEEEIGSLEEEIQQLDAIRDRLVERLKLNHVRVLLLRTSVAPHKKLPPEILSKIFIDCLDGSPTSVPPDFTSAVPWSLGQVCSKWRTVCQAEPALWNRLRVRSLENDAGLVMIRDILSNSCRLGGVELTLTPESHAHWANGLDLVTNYRSQLQGLGLELNKSCLIPLGQPIAQFCELQSLLVRFDNFQTTLRRNGAPVSGFSATSNLRRLTIESTSYPDFTAEIKDVFMWSQLTDLTLINISKSSTFLVLGYCPQIVNLDVSFSSGAITPVFANVLTFPCLRSISLTSRGTVKKILKPLITPCLKHIVFTSESGVPCVDCVDIIGLVQRSSCQIEYFQTKGFVIAVENVPPLMQAMPFLTTWKVLTAGPIPASMLSTILIEKLVPDLHTLHDWEVPSVPSAVSFMRERFVQAGAVGGAKIMEADIWITKDGWSHEDEAYFQRALPELQTHGRRVRVRPCMSKRQFGNWV